MAATRNDVKALAKARYPSAAAIELKRLSDFKTLGVRGNGADQPDWLLTIGGGKDAIEFKADSLDMLQALLSAN
jgi:hypothetical protein